MISLYDDQQDLLERATNIMRSGCKSLLIQSATGSGKSVVASELVRRATNKGSKTWFIVPRRDLIRQMSKTYSAFNLEHSFIAADYIANPFAPTHICSMQTLANRLDRLNPPNLAIIDEAHVGGEGLDKLVKWLKQRGSYILALSATPTKLSGQGMGIWFDDMVCGLPIRKLINRGRLSDYKAFAPSHPDLSSIKISAGDYAKNQLSSYMEADRVLVGNAVAHYKKHAMGKLGISYCVSIAHSKMVADSFNQAGIPAAHMDGDTPEHERKRIITAYANRELLQLTNCDLLTYGFDLASQVGRDVTVECMSDLRPTKSLALQMQKWGRVLRKKDFPALIFDHANNVSEHGLPCQEREWSLESKKKRSREQGEINIQVRQCDKCMFCHVPASICPNCGYEYPIQSRDIEEVDGELEELKIAETKKQERMEVGKAKTYAELYAIANARGYAKGWVFHAAKAKGIKS